MWFSREQFALCNELRIWGLAPRFEPGDVVARGFADLGFEEFQVLPGSMLLSLTAGTVSAIPEGHRDHFFWIPSFDEAIDMVEMRGGTVQSLLREDARTWVFEFLDASGIQRVTRARTAHEVSLKALYVSFSGKEL